MNSRQRFHAVMNYEAPDHGIYLLPWLGFPETLERWRREGLRDGDLEAYPTDAWSIHGGWFFPHPPFERTVVEEDGRHILYVNPEGILLREFKDDPWSSMPQFVRFPVETREDFRRFAKERLQPDLAGRLGPDWRERLRALRNGADMLWCLADRWGGFFGPLRNLLGVENLCTTFYTDPAFIEEMMDTVADYVIAQAGQLLDVIDVDLFGLWEDMAYNHGPLIDPELVRRYMLPRYVRVLDYLRSRGVQWLSMDSDGRVDTLVPIWLDAGFNLIYPFEVASGMDVVAMRRRFGRDLRMYMGIDKRAIAEGPAAIDRALEHIRPLLDEGGFIPNVDHSLPPDIPYDHFKYYMERLAITLGL